MNSVYLSSIKLCAVSRSLSVSMVICVPLCNVRSKCECAHTMEWAWYRLSGRTYTISMTNIQACASPNKFYHFCVSECTQCEWA